jgi:hypothetical protein
VCIEAKQLAHTIDRHGQSVTSTHMLNIAEFDQ